MLSVCGYREQIAAEKLSINLLYRVTGKDGQTSVKLLVCAMIIPWDEGRRRDLACMRG